MSTVVEIDAESVGMPSIYTRYEYEAGDRVVCRRRAGMYGSGWGKSLRFEGIIIGKGLTQSQWIVQISNEDAKKVLEKSGYTAIVMDSTYMQPKEPKRTQMRK